MNASIGALRIQPVSVAATTGRESMNCPTDVPSSASKPPRSARTHSSAIPSLLLEQRVEADANRIRKVASGDGHAELLEPLQTLAVLVVQVQVGAHLRAPRGVVDPAYVHGDTVQHPRLCEAQHGRHVAR